MSRRTDHSSLPDKPLGAGLLIVTGASHTGKSSVIRALVPQLPPPVAVLAVDDILDHTLVRPHGDRWEGIPLSYELIRRQASALLDQGWLVIVESTFTYVPSQGAATFHHDALDLLISLAKSREAPWVLCQVQAPPESTLERGRESSRLGSDVIAETIRLHEEFEPPAGALSLSTAEQLPEAAALTLFGRLPASFTRT